MALQKSEFPLVVDGGINTKIDPKLLPIGQNIGVVNASYEKLGAIEKLAGTIKAPPYVTGGDDINLRDLRKVRSFGKKLLAIGEEGSLDFLSYDNSLSQWVEKTTPSYVSGCPVGVGSIKAGGETAGAHYPDSDEAPLYGARAVVHTELDRTGAIPTTHISIQDYGTTETREIATISGAGLAQVKVRDDASNPIIWVGYQHAATLKNRVATYDKYGTLIGDVEIAIVSSVRYAFHMQKKDNFLFVASLSTGALSIKLCRVDVDGSLGIDVTKTVIATMNAQKGSIRLLLASNIGYVVFRDLNSDAVIFGVFLTDLTSISLSDQYFVDHTSVGVEAHRFSLIFSSDGNYIYGVFQAITTTSVRENDTYLMSCSTAGVVNFEGSLTPSNICSSPFRVDDSDDFYIVLSSEGKLQKTYFLCRITKGVGLGSTVARFSTWKAAPFKFGIPYNAANEIIYWTIPDVTKGDDQKYYFANQYTGRTVNVDSEIYGVPSVQISEFDFDSDSYGHVALLGENLLIGGGVPCELIGKKIYEQNFNQYPEAVSVQNGPAGSFTGGTYIYKAVYEFVDDNGIVHKSTPSVPISFLATTGLTVDVVFRPAGFQYYSAKVNLYTSLVIYRTLRDTSGPFYRLTDGSVNLFGVDTSVTFYDDLADSEIFGNELLYTDTGVLSFDPLPPTRALATANGRVFALLSEDPNVIWYSQKWVPGEPVNFSAFLTLRIDGGLFRETGEGVSLAVINSIIIALKDTSIIGFEGDGPLPSGAQNNFTDPKLISSDIGCSNPRSVVTSPVGVFFKSGKGIYLLDSSLQVTYIGAAVELYNSETILDSAVIEKKNLVIFVTENRALLYNYQQNKWSTSSFLAGKSCCNWQGNLAVLKDDNNVYIQADGVYTDSTDQYGMKLVTPWLKVKGIQNFGRVYKIMMLGEFHAAHTVSVKVYYDYDDTDYDTYTVSPSAADSIYQYEIHLERQKSQSIKIEVEDVPDVGSSGQSMTLSNLSLLLGVKPGLYKGLSDSKKY